MFIIVGHKFICQDQELLYMRFVFQIIWLDLHHECSDLISYFFFFAVQALEAADTLW